MNKFWMMLGCGLLCAACTEDPTQERGAEPLVTIHLSVAALAPTSGRTEVAPDGYNVLWSPGDTIGVYVQSGANFTTHNAPMVFEGTSASASGVFSGDITLSSDVSEYTLYAYYPYAPQAGADASAVLFTLSAEQTQAVVGGSTHLGNSDFLVAGAVTGTVESVPPLAFRHAFAVVEVNLVGTGIMAGKQLADITLYSTDAAIAGADGSLSGASNLAGSFSFDLTSGTANNTATLGDLSTQIDYCRLAFAEPPVLGATPTKAYLTINPANYSLGEGRMYFVARTTDGYTATFSRPGIAIGSGQMKVVTQQLSSGVAPQPAVDLTASEALANCYVVSLAAQEYSFNATVAGNGVVTAGLQQAVQTFEGRTLSASLSGSVARLLWQSSPHLIDAASVVYRDGKIFFTLTTRPTLLGGNAVIGLFSSTDPAAEAVWSWHIWISDRSNEELIAQAQTYLLYGAYEQEYGSYSTQMMDRNLGAIYNQASPYARSVKAPLYQWGRKDPLPWGLVIYDAQDAPQRYLQTYPPVLSTGSTGAYAGYTGNTHYASAHPLTFLVTSQATSYDWYYGAGEGTTPAVRNNELWGNPMGYQVGVNTTKTLFDPCPPGWKVPHPYVFSAFSKIGSTATIANGETRVTGSFVQGWDIYYGTELDTTYYPGVGFRYDVLGIFAFASSGYYWSSAPAPPDTFGAWIFGLTPTMLQQRVSDPRGFGLPVRCMRDLPTP